MSRWKFGEVVRINGCSTYIPGIFPGVKFHPLILLDVVVGSRING